MINFQSLIKEQCTQLFPERWNIPITWMINLPASEILSIESNGVTLQEISGQRHTMEGYSKQIGEYLHLSIIDGNLVNITVESEEYDVMGISQFWNNHTAAITIAAHETTDLFKWSKRFVDQENLVFTWLVEPRAIDSADWLPYAAVAVGAIAVLTMLIVLKREGLGPLARQESQQ